MNFIALVKKRVKEKENSDLKPVVICLEVSLLSHPNVGGKEEMGKYTYNTHWWNTL